MIDKTLHGIDMSGLPCPIAFPGAILRDLSPNLPVVCETPHNGGIPLRMTTLEATPAAAAVPTRPRAHRRIRWIPLSLPGLTRLSMPRPAPCLSARSLDEDPRKDPMAASGLAFGPQRPT
jgi:hypothetical protein